MTKLIVTRQAVNAPARKLKATWTVESTRNWFSNTPYNRALDNFWRDWVAGKLHGDWAPELWEPWGFTLEDYTLKIIDEQKFTMFVLRWA